MATTKQVMEQPTTTGNNSDQWARIPRTGQTLEGFYRSQLFELVREGKIKSAAIKQPGQIRAGARLIHLPSLRKYIEGFVDSGAAK